MIPDALRFLLYNWQHYRLAAWGLRLRLDPPYPWILKFLPSLICEPVFEYRTYGAVALWAGLLAWILPAPASVAFVVFWFGQSLHRSRYFRSNLAYWRQASRENPFPNRAHARYVEQLIREAERLEKSGKSGEMALREAQKLMDRVCAAPTAKDRF